VIGICQLLSESLYSHTPFCSPNPTFADVSKVRAFDDEEGNGKRRRCRVCAFSLTGGGCSASYRFYHYVDELWLKDDTIVELKGVKAGVFGFDPMSFQYSEVSEV